MGGAQDLQQPQQGDEKQHCASSRSTPVRRRYPQALQLKVGKARGRDQAAREKGGQPPPRHAAAAVAQARPVPVSVLVPSLQVPWAAAMEMRAERE